MRIVWSRILSGAGESLVLVASALLGAAIRYRSVSRQRELEDVRHREREQPEVAANALATIEEAASRTLADMRSMVGALRREDDQADTVRADGPTPRSRCGPTRRAGCRGGR